MITFVSEIPMVRESSVKTRTCTPQDVVDTCKDIRDSSQEMFLVLDLDSKHYLIERRMISLGIANASLVHPREVFRGAIANGASFIICVHNHPSGDPTPSDEDLKISRQLVGAGKIIGIRVLDSVIVGRKSDDHRDMISLLDDGLVDFLVKTKRRRLK